MYLVSISPHLPRFQEQPSKSRLFPVSFVRSQSIQKENKRTLRTQIMCDVETLTPGEILFRTESHVFASEEYECK